MGRGCRIALAVLAIAIAPVIGSPAAPAAEAPPAPQKVVKTTETGILCPTTSEEARQAYNNAFSLKRQGKLREAEEAYRKAIQFDPKYCDAMDNLGVLLRGRGELDEAAEWYRRSLAVKPDNPVAHQDLAVVYSIKGDRAKTEAEYRWLIEHDPTNPEGYYGLGNSRLAAGEAVAAVEPLERAAELYRAASSPLLPDAQYLLGVAFFRQKEYAKAKEYLLLVYPVRENDPNVNLLLGLCYLDPAVGDRKEAKRYFLRAQELGLKLPQDIEDELAR